MGGLIASTSVCAKTVSPWQPVLFLMLKPIQKIMQSFLELEYRNIKRGKGTKRDPSELEEDSFEDLIYGGDPTPIPGHFFRKLISSQARIMHEQLISTPCVSHGC